jgi:hypothetical protein
MVYSMLIGGAFFLIVLMVGFTFFSSFFENIYLAFAEQLEASKNRSTTRTGSTVCDLRFEIFGAFDEAPFGFDLEIKQRLYLGVGSPNSGGQVFHPEVAVVNFRECETKQSGISGFIQSIAPTFHVEKLRNIQASLLAFTNITPQEFQVEMEFFRVDDGTSLGTKVVRKTEPAGAKLPFAFDEVFVFDNVELNDYNVHITCSGDCTKINTLPSGEPYVYRIRN